jgi:hypothetical protein
MRDGKQARGLERAGTGTERNPKMKSLPPRPPALFVPSRSSVSKAHKKTRPRRGEPEQPSRQAPATRRRRPTGAASPRLAAKRSEGARKAMPPDRHCHAAAHTPVPPLPSSSATLDARHSCDRTFPAGPASHAPDHQTKHPHPRIETHARIDLTFLPKQPRHRFLPYPAAATPPGRHTVLQRHRHETRTGHAPDRDLAERGVFAAEEEPTRLVVAARVATQRASRPAGRPTSREGPPSRSA